MEEKISLPHQHGETHLDDICHQLSKDTQFLIAAECFKQLSDPTRLRIFWLLCHHEECVINIAALLSMSSPAVAHHLRSLHECGLIQSRRDGKEVHYKASENEISSLLHEVVEQIMEMTCPKKNIDFHGSSEDVIHQVHEYLLEHLSERITIEELSRQFLMNPTTLKQTFKEIYGNSIAAHIKEHRMEKAAALLRDSSDSIARIASFVGYESQSRFTTAFKETYGMLPSEYRKQ